MTPLVHPEGTERRPLSDDVRAELTRGRLEWVGSGFEKIVFGSPRWVVKIPRGERGFLASLLATAVKARTRRLRRWSLSARRHVSLGVLRPRLAAPWNDRVAWHLLQVGFNAVLAIVPARMWRTSGAGRRAHELRMRAKCCEQVAAHRLEGTPLVPRRVELPPTLVRARRWGRSMIVTTAFQRVDRTLLDEIRRCARLRRFEEYDQWLGRFLSLQTELWGRGAFFGASNPFENHGVLGDRLLLIEDSGLTDDPREILESLDTVRARWVEHARGLCVATARPESGEALAQKLVEMLQPSVVRRHWPRPDDPRWNA